MAAQYVAALAARLPEDPRHHHGVALAEVFAATKPRGQAAVVLSYLTASTDSSSYQILDEQGTVVGCSDGWLRIIGYTAAEALGRSSRHLHGPRTNFHAVQKVEEAMRRGEMALGPDSRRDDVRPHLDLGHIGGDGHVGVVLRAGELDEWQLGL